MTFWETIQRGEYVMFALFLLFILIICLWWVRGVKLRRLNRSYHDLMQRVRDHVVEGDVENARQICSGASTPGSRVIDAGLSRVGHRLEEVRWAVEDASVLEKEKLSAGAIWLHVIAVISPLLGLGGTLVGIIDRLRDLGESTEIVDTAMICAEISPTIVTTVAGLGVGIFALIAGSCLDTSIKKARERIDQLVTEFYNLLNQPV